MKRWASLAAAALLLAACTSRTTTLPGPMPAPPPAAPPAAPPPPAASEPVPVPEDLTRVATPVSVGLTVDASALEITADGDFVVEDEDGGEVARLGAGEAARFAPDGRGRATLQAGGRTRSGLRLPLVVQAPGEGVLSARGVPYRGVLRVQAAPGGGLTLVNRLDLESYLLGVVPREIGQVGPELIEAAKAQAVAARTYAVRYLGRRAAQGFDVFATVDDQVYGGVAAERGPVSRAVIETAGEILAYGGQPILAYYHSTCAGRTAAIEEVWNDRPLPYLVSVEDVDPRTGEAFDRASSRFRWTERWSHDQLVAILNRTLADSLRGRRISEIREMRVLDRTRSGRVRSLRLATDAGTFMLGRDRVRWILVPTRGGLLNSSMFDVRLERDGGRVSQVVVEGGGWGHGIGMCQVGAMGRARAGQDYRTILDAYYPGTEIQDLY